MYSNLLPLKWREIVPYHMAYHISHIVHSAFTYSIVILYTFTFTYSFAFTKNQGSISINDCRNIYYYKLWLLYFFIKHLADPWPTLGHWWGDSLTYSMLITAHYQFRNEAYLELLNEVGPKARTNVLVRFESPAYQFRVDMLSHCATLQC